jgi:hypothetical protein
MILKIEGSDKKISQIARELKIRARRGNLKITIEKSEKAKPPVNSGNELPKHAADLIELIQKVESLEGLKPFESDKRVTVVEAVNAKREELDLT